jgi:hypothetical protein
MGKQMHIEFWWGTSLKASKEVVVYEYIHIKKEVSLPYPV